MSCRVTRQQDEVPLETKTEIRDRLVDVAAVQDSGAIRAYFECDSNNKVVLKEYNQLMSDFVSLQSLMTPTDKGALFTVDLNTNHPSTKAAVRDSIVYKDVPVYVKGDDVRVEKDLSWIQTSLIWSGLIAWILLLIYLIVTRFFKH
ncbi:MAG: hypothetical protein V1775_18375 [Bacteroidota bacterium]